MKIKQKLAVLCFSLVSITGLAEPVDLNTATATEIAQSLSGIGLTRAQKIIVYRDKFGPIDTPEELLAIKGIGEKTLEKNRAKIITRLIGPAGPINRAQGLDEIPSNH